MWQRKLKILIIEPHDEHRFLAKQCLLRAAPEIEVEICESGDQAMQRLVHDAGWPDIILLDIDLPDRSGLTFIQQVKQTFPNKLTPILLLTDGMDEALLREAYRAGAAGYIEKPMNVPRNLQKLQNYLDMLQIPLTVWPYSHIPPVQEGMLV